MTFYVLLHLSKYAMKCLKLAFYDSCHKEYNVVKHSNMGIKRTVLIIPIDKFQVLSPKRIFFKKCSVMKHAISKNQNLQKKFFIVFGLGPQGP